MWETRGPQPPLPVNDVCPLDKLGSDCFALCNELLLSLPNLLAW